MGHCPAEYYTMKRSAQQIIARKRPVLPFLAIAVGNQSAALPLETLIRTNLMRDELLRYFRACLLMDELRAWWHCAEKDRSTAREIWKSCRRRASYDDGLVRAHGMAVAIGGMRNYEAFAGFGLDSYEQGALDHNIGARPVFAVDTLDKLEEEKLLWDAAAVAVKAGLPLGAFLRRNGWSEEQVAEYEASPERQAKVAGMEAAQLGLQTLRDAGESGGGFAGSQVEGEQVDGL